jgi:2-polyprenyl-3-methyl-5-hydroxy-6-metoxy-1,4-benzoquinol methylase
MVHHKDQNEHNKLVLDQFTKQAVPFSKKVPAHSNEGFFKLIIGTAGINKKDTVLDIACGPGMLSCAIAKIAGHVTGIDLVPSMIEQARLLQQEKKLSNMDWKLGDVSELPFADASFSAVVTRFSFHHFLKPSMVLKEMVRVTRPKGKIGVVDVFTTSPAHSRLHNLLEKLRDDSHVKALSLSQLQAMAKDAGLINLKIRFYRLEIELESQLRASFPKPGDADKIRQLVMKDKDGLVSVRRDKGIYLVYPIAIIAGKK